MDLERRQLLLLRTKNGTARVVILTASAVKALEELRTRRNPDSKQVCLTRYGEPMVSPRAWFELVMEEAIKKNPALHDVTWHSFRHTYISRLVMAGVLNGGDTPKRGEFFRGEGLNDGPAPFELVDLRDELEDFRGDRNVGDAVHG